MSSRPDDVTDVRNDEPSSVIAVTSAAVTDAAEDLEAHTAVVTVPICTTCSQPLGDKEPVVIEGYYQWHGPYRIQHTDCADPYYQYNRQTWCHYCHRMMWCRQVGRLSYCCDYCRTAQAERRAQWRAPSRTRTCERCATDFEGRADARYCSTRCRVAAHRTTTKP